MVLLSGLQRWPALISLALWPAMVLAKDPTVADTPTPAAADFYVSNLPGIPKDGPHIKMHAGHIEITPEHNGNLFFWHFESQHVADKQRTVIWLNGGPGCSSEDGAMMEVGPYRVKGEDLVLNNGSWNEFANLLFVDNPVGTGFSLVDTDSFVHELEDMANQFVKFLEKFFALFPHYARDDIYIAGESYAGQHIPHISKAILDRNKNNPDDAWSLQGLLIGNGWISPRDQYPTYASYALEHGLITKGSAEDEELKQKLRVCERMYSSEPGRVDYSECEDILGAILKLTKKGNGADSCINMYDIRLRDIYPSCGMNWPPDLKDVTPYLRRQDVVRALHISNKKTVGWSECNGAVGAAFSARNSKPSVELLPGILKEVPVLLFSGDKDLICNHLGTEALISRMEWNGGKGFEVTPGNWAPRRDWTFEDEPTGFWQEARNLTYVLFYNSSHMVPFDLPRASRDMLDRFMRVDISNIGGDPTDSRIDGEKGPQTTVGGASNHTESAETEHQKQLDDAKWAAYRKSGEVVLVIVIIAVICWGIFIWRERRKSARYHALAHNEPVRHEGYRSKSQPGDLEASAFDENELDDLHAETPTTATSSRFPRHHDNSSEVRHEKFVTKYAEPGP